MQVPIPDRHHYVIVCIKHDSPPDRSPSVDSVQFARLLFSRPYLLSHLVFGINDASQLSPPNTVFPIVLGFSRYSTFGFRAYLSFIRPYDFHS